MNCICCHPLGKKHRWTGRCACLNIRSHRSGAAHGRAELNLPRPAQCLFPFRVRHARNNEEVRQFSQIQRVRALNLWRGHSSRWVGISISGPNSSHECLGHPNIGIRAKQCQCQILGPNVNTQMRSRENTSYHLG